MNGDDNVEQSISLEEARKLAELTDRIVCNLKVINHDGNPDLEETLRQTGYIVSNLSTINEDENNLDDLFEKTNSIVSNLQTINES
jgi:hypothetical protein